MVRGEEISPLMRAALTADFSNGVSSVLDFEKYTFINGDLSVSFARQPVGAWILLDAETWVGATAAGRWPLPGSPTGRGTSAGRYRAC